MKSLLIILFLFPGLNLSAQETLNYSKTESSAVHEYVDEFPSFPGGNLAYTRFLSEYLQYPENARRKKIEGTVYLSMVVTKEGKITDVKVLKDIGEGCGAEAKRVVERMPNWSPGKINGEPVNVLTSVRIKFSLLDLYRDYPPSFPGGDEMYEAYVKKNLEIPRKVADEFIDDYVMVSFVILPTGEIRKVRLKKGIDSCIECNQNAIKMIEGMPAWKPGLYDGYYEAREATVKLVFSYKAF